MPNVQGKIGQISDFFRGACARAGNALTQLKIEDQLSRYYMASQGLVLIHGDDYSLESSSSDFVEIGEETRALIQKDALKQLEELGADISGLLKPDASEHVAPEDRELYVNNHS